MRLGTPSSRLALLGAVMLVTAGIANLGARPGLTRLADSLDTLPMTLGTWQGHIAPAFSPEVIRQLGVDEYLSRIYVSGDAPVSLYVGYYGSQRGGDSIHSPQNCLPGAGWLPVTTSRLTIPIAGRAEPITINRLLIQKGLDRQVVLYWYQSLGRVVASDFQSKAYLVYDAVRLRRSDAAMVRIITPVLASDADEATAEARAVDLVREAFPQISRLLPI